MKQIEKDQWQAKKKNQQSNIKSHFKVTTMNLSFPVGKVALTAGVLMCYFIINTLIGYFLHLHFKIITNNCSAQEKVGGLLDFESRDSCWVSALQMGSLKPAIRLLELPSPPHTKSWFRSRHYLKGLTYINSILTLSSEISTGSLTLPRGTTSQRS